MTNTATHSKKPNSNTNDTKVAEQFASTAHDTVDKMTEVAENAEQKIRTASQDLAKKSSEVAGQAKQYVNDKPIASLGIAFGAGVLLAALLKR